jgi:flavin-dependent dehydrogenase
VRRTDPLILGGGPAGAAAAIALARAGKRALILDRNREPPDQLCGGFLGWDALALLRTLDINAGALGARPIRRVRLIAGSTVVEAPLPRGAAGLSRRALDSALLARARVEGAEVETGVTVRAVEPATNVVRLADGTDLSSAALFLATGKHDLRGSTRPLTAAGADPAVGIRARLAPSPALTSDLDGVIELHLFRHGYAGLLLQEDGAANLCLSVVSSRLREAGGSVSAMIEALAVEAPRLGDRLAASSLLTTWQAVAGVPYGWRATTSTPGLFRLGDQAAVIASLAGDGVAIALASGSRAAARFLRDGPQGAPAFQRDFAAAAGRPLAVAGGLRRLAESPAAGLLLGMFGRVPGLPALLARVTRIESA